MAEGSSQLYSRYLVLLKVKKICLFFLPLFIGYLFLQTTLGISEPLAVSTGRSMEPSIHEGDILVYKGITAEEVVVGDIILFEVPDEMRDLLPPRITHRVIEIREVSGEIVFRTKGDNAPLDTYELPASNVIGKNVAVIPYVGMIILLAKNPYGVAAIIALLIISKSRGNRE